MHLALRAAVISGDLFRQAWRIAGHEGGLATVLVLGVEDDLLGWLSTEPSIGENDERGWRGMERTSSAC